MASIENFPRVDMAKLEAEVTAEVPRVGVTVEAVKREYESAAKEFEAMGAELISAAKKCEALTTDVQNMIRDTAEAYRREGKKIFERIEECAFFTENVRKTCEDVKRRMIEGNGGAHQ
jgi:ribose 5-phosphate isomerase